MSYADLAWPGSARFAQGNGEGGAVEEEIKPLWGMKNKAWTEMAFEPDQSNLCRIQLPPVVSMFAIRKSATNLDTPQQQLNFSECLASFGTFGGDFSSCRLYSPGASRGLILTAVAQSVCPAGALTTLCSSQLAVFHQNSYSHSAGAANGGFCCSIGLAGIAAHGCMHRPASALVLQ